MFFVGATGQLLTLILTVCLPFVFLLSGNQKLEVQSTTNYVSIVQIHEEIIFPEISSIDYKADFIDEEKNYHFEFDDYLIKQDFPDYNFHVNWKSVYSKSSGNKAPPVFHSFSC